jgi:hypothetical protein
LEVEEVGEEAVVLAREAGFHFGEEADEVGFGRVLEGEDDGCFAGRGGVDVIVVFEELAEALIHGGVGEVGEAAAAEVDVSEVLTHAAFDLVDGEEAGDISGNELFQFVLKFIAEEVETGLGIDAVFGRVLRGFGSTFGSNGAFGFGSVGTRGPPSLIRAMAGKGIGLFRFGHGGGTSGGIFGKRAAGRRTE